MNLEPSGRYIEAETTIAKSEELTKFSPALQANVNKVQNIKDLGQKWVVHSL